MGALQAAPALCDAFPFVRRGIPAIAPRNRGLLFCVLSHACAGCGVFGVRHALSPAPSPKRTRQRPWGAGGGCDVSTSRAACKLIPSRRVNRIHHMNALAELLDAVRERSGLPSDMALATKLGIQRQTLHQARKGVAGLSDERIAQLCELGKLDGAVWLAKIHAERATSPVERRVWRSVLDRLSAAAAVLVLAVIAMPGAARAKAIDSQGFSGSDQPHSVYYVTNRVATQEARASPVLRSLTSLLASVPTQSPQR